MPILATLRKEGFGKWTTLADYWNDVRLRETGAIGALATVLSAEPAEQKELASGEGALYMVEVASDLRVPKGARLAAVRAAMEAGLDGELLKEAFLGAGDLLTDPRLGGAAKKLAELGLPAAAQKSEEARRVSDAAGAFARAAHAAASVLGPARVKELLAAQGPGHSGVAAAGFALGGELPAADRDAWQKLLNEQCGKHRKAPAAAKRMGLAPPWPPFLPDAFGPMIKAAETANEGVASRDALVSRAPAMPLASTGAAATLLPTAGPQARKLEAPIRSRRLPPPQTRVVTEAPVERPAQQMPAVMARPTSTPAKVAEELQQRPIAIASKGPQPGGPATRVEEKAAPGLPAGAVYEGRDELRFDPNGRRLSREDRFRDDAFEWQEPILPSSRLRPAGRATVVEGPFAHRLKSLFEDRPEAVDRLCAAADARAALAGEATVEGELSRELKLARWQKRTTPQAQVQRLQAVAQDAAVPEAWRRAAQAILARPREES